MNDQNPYEPPTTYREQQERKPKRRWLTWWFVLDSFCLCLSGIAAVLMIEWLVARFFGRQWP